MQKRKRQVLGRLGIKDSILWKGRTDSNPPGWIRVYLLSRNLAREAPSQDSPNLLFSFLYNSPFRNFSHRVGGGGEEGACAWSWFLGRICGFAGRMHIFPHWYDRKMWVSLPEQLDIAVAGATLLGIWEETKQSGGEAHYPGGQPLRSGGLAVSARWCLLPDFSLL